jgi:Putative MetA-pathway of phenol degradation
MRFFGAAALVGVLQMAQAFADESPDKSGYNFFRPTPDALLREMATDRPDKTESAYTVDAGHFQVEMDLLSYTHDRSDSESLEGWAIAPINLKVGVRNNVDLQLIAETYNVQRTKDRDTNGSMRLSGFGDLLLRCKTNLWGNDGGPTAFAVMPFVKIPTNQDGLGNKAFEGGIIFPFAMDLPAEWGLGAQAEVDHVQNSDSSDYHQEFSNTVTVSHDIVGKLAGYVEIYSNVSTESDAPWIATFDFGFTYAITRDIQLDAGMNVGLTDAADDLNPFIGLSMRY